MMAENKADQYRTMLAYLNDLGADLAGHTEASLAKTSAATIPEMNKSDLLHYQRVLEATIDNPHTLMDKEAMKEELAEVVRERFSRGEVGNKIREARAFRERLASLDSPRYAVHVKTSGSIDAMIDHKGHIYEADSRDASALCGHDWSETYASETTDPTRGIYVGGYDDPRGTLAQVQAVASKNKIAVCQKCAYYLKENF